MAHQMKNLHGFFVFHCVEGAFGASSGGTPKMKNGAPRDELKNGRGHGWAVPYKWGLRPLCAIAQSSAIVHFYGLCGPLSRRSFRRKMTAIAGNRGQL